ncbi:aldo/keto reductase [Clostridium sp. AM58-1XD]|uniref:aldo/keto reductase n=1 Tax=Clostridium sp. AM58-1XD TaxID=2292307 RepID=UPI000E54D26F|nr:aldo/keto reductase [Clostridium sp. AM58-1XD]RGZ01222.1 aldo/keto reductase [Clostridium sp. AM58-1XD]
MNNRILNNARLSVSELSLGTWAFSGAAVWGPCDETAAVDTVHCALDYGINLIDTAEKYGNGMAEIVLGKALAGKRHQAVVASKPAAVHMHKEDIIKTCEDSLKRLQTDYIDIYQIHWPNPSIPVDETYEGLEQLKKDGKILAVGVCNHGEGALREKGNWEIVTDQLPYSLIWRVGEKHFTSDLKKREIAVWAYSPLSQGLLTGKYLSVGEVPLNRRTTRIYDSKWGAGRHTDSGYEGVVFPFLRKLNEMCTESGYTMTNVAMQFLKRKQIVASVLAGARNISQLTQNIEAFEKPVADDFMEQVEKMSLDLKAHMGDNADLWENQNGGRIY